MTTYELGIAVDVRGTGVLVSWREATVDGNVPPYKATAWFFPREGKPADSQPFTFSPSAGLTGSVASIDQATVATEAARQWLNGVSWDTGMLPLGPLADDLVAVLSKEGTRLVRLATLHHAGHIDLNVLKSSSCSLFDADCEDALWLASIIG